MFNPGIQNLSTDKNIAIHEHRYAAVKDSKEIKINFASLIKHANAINSQNEQFDRYSGRKPVLMCCSAEQSLPGRVQHNEVIRHLEKTDSFRDIDAMNRSLDKIASAAGQQMNTFSHDRISFSNVIGNASTLTVLQSILAALNAQENMSDIQAASWSKNTIALANLAGDKTIAAARERMTGAISAGVVSISMQGGASVASMKALTTESRSITNNLGRSNTIARELQESQDSIQSSVDSMIHRGEPLESHVQATMSGAHPANSYESAELRHQHLKITNNTSKVRVASDFITQTANSVHSVIQGGAEVSAASRTKEAEFAKANQTVSNDVEHNHDKISKKYSESGASLRQILLAVLGSSNDSVSFIASHMA
ncbi:hypothetical protein DV589_24735 [Salmonella enterica]|nr:hypothetical protein [Salmonella enterica]EKF0976915.1 hypothetical protein [Salmonella enterica]